MKMFTRCFSVAALSLFFAVFAVASVSAQQGVNVRGEFQNTLERSGLAQRGSQANVYNAIGQVVNAFLGLIGIAVFVLVVYAGALWILAAGNETNVETAKAILKGAVIGLVIIFASYVIVNFTLQQLNRALGTNSTVGEGQ